MNLGKITSDDLVFFLSLSDGLFREVEEAKAILFEKSTSLFASDCARPCWCHLYELPVLQHVEKGVALIGDEAILQRLAGAENQIREAIHWLMNSRPRSMLGSQHPKKRRKSAHHWQ